MKSKSSKRTPAPYTWHLRRPFKCEFDREHWWMGKLDSTIEPAAAAYELARRHPMVGKTRCRFRKKPWYGSELRGPMSREQLRQALTDLQDEPDAVACLCLVSL